MFAFEAPGERQSFRADDERQGVADASLAILSTSTQRTPAAVSRGDKARSPAPTGSAQAAMRIVNELAASSAARRSPVRQAHRPRGGARTTRSGPANSASNR